jgi:hypothetical protein
MKVRNGFVSNSSSSSFIIVSKDGNLTQEKLMKAFDISEKSPLYPVAKDVAKSMMCADKYSCEKFLDNYSYADTVEEKVEQLQSDYPEYFKIYENAKNNGWTIYMGSADSYDEPALCEMSIDYEDDNIIIEKEGGY